MMKCVIGLDPGPRETGWIIIDRKTKLPLRSEPLDKTGFGHEDNFVVRDTLRFLQDKEHYVAYEDIKNYGRIVGDDVFKTCEWIGVFREVCAHRHITGVPKKTYVTHFCGLATSGDSALKQAIYDVHGGSRKTAVGTKKSPGPLYGLTHHVWNAYAVAVYTAKLIDAKLQDNH